MGSAAGTDVAAFLLTIRRLHRLFWLDNVTHMASVELWVLLTTLLLVIRFLLEYFGPWYANKRMMAIILTMETLNHNLVVYTMGLMQLSGAQKVNDYFQVWGVLLVTLQYSVKIGRPYTRSKQIPLLDLMSSFWSANLLRVQTFFLLRLPLWLIWSLNAVRIILFFVSAGKAETINQASTRLVSDYMKSEAALCGDDNQKKSAMTFAGDDKEFDMRGYKYLVHGEHLVLKKVQQAPQELASCFKKGTREEHEKQNTSEVLDRGYKIQLDPDKKHKKQLVTVEKIWNDAGESGLLGRTADRDNQRKDMCLSFALYKLLRRRFYNLPIHEHATPQGKEKISRLVFDYILGNDCQRRAFRITEVELSFLQDLFYSKHATLFAGGFLIPATSLLLSLLLAASTGYIAYPVRYIPERMDQADRNRILHGVFITRLMVGIIVVKELGQIYLYVFSRWAKVLMLCKYVKHRCLRNPVVERAMRWMLHLNSKARWNQKIGQHNLLILSRVLRPGLIPPFTMNIVYCRGHAPGRIHLEDYTKDAILNSLRSLKNKDQRELGKYFSNAFRQKLAWPSRELEVDTHIILVWHIATCLCEIKFFDEVKALKAVDPLGRGARGRPRPLVGKPKAPAAPDKQAKSESLWCKQYAVAVSLSNYCAYLVTRALVPDNGLVAKKVFDEVIREIDHVTSDKGMRPQLPKEKVGSMEDVYERFMATANLPRKDKYPDQGGEPDEEMPEGGDQEEEPKQDDDDDDLNIENSLTKMGAQLGKRLIEVYDGNAAELWTDLAEFWTGFLLHLAASTKAAKHRTHLGGSGELITHLWALLSHAGFDGPSHGQQLLDPEDLQDVNPFMA